MGLLGLAGSLLGMIPKVGSPGGKKKGKSGGSKGKSSKKSSKKKGSTKKKQRKSNKKKKKKKRRKKKKKWGKFFTKARKLKNSLSKSKLVKRAKKAIKKAVLTTKKVVQKTKATVTKAKQQVKAAVKQTKQVVKEKVLPAVKKAAQATTKVVKNAVKPKNLLDTLQVGLDLIGLIPGVGEVADGVNGLIYLARGDKVNAALSFGAMIPIVGWAATGGKFVKKGAGVVKGISQGVQNVLKGPVGRVVEKAKKQVANVKTQIQTKVAEVKQQLRQMLRPPQQWELAGAGGDIRRVEDTGTVGRNTTTPSPKPSNSQPTPSPKAVNYGEHFTKNGRKKVLKPNVEYKTPEGYTYRTDSNGRITDCEGTLVLGTAERNAYAQRTVGGKDRLPDDDGGHLIGAQFKGPKDIDNLVPQNSQINRSGGEWFNMETEWANALKETPPKKVTVQINPTYSGNSMRPDSFEVTYQIGNKREVTRTILNQPGG